MQASDLSRFVEDIIAGSRLAAEDATELTAIAEPLLPLLFAGAERLRRHFRGEAVALCGIVNARSGGCDQDCAFCAQSARHQAGAPVYPFVDGEKIARAARLACESGAGRFSVVTSGKRLSGADLDRAVTGIQAIADESLMPCASLGILDQPSLRRLKSAGLVRYHHNLETSRSFYARVCSTRSYDDNVEALFMARRAGLEVCSGCLFGLGETWAQRIELFLDLRELPVDSVPLNFLIPIPGTPLADRPRLSPAECLRIIALARFCLPDRHVVVCGGRNENLGARQNEIFRAGASGMMIGDLLTVRGRESQDDLNMLAELGLAVSKA